MNLSLTEAAGQRGELDCLVEAGKEVILVRQERVAACLVVAEAKPDAAARCAVLDAIRQSAAAYRANTAVRTRDCFFDADGLPG